MIFVFTDYTEPKHDAMDPSIQTGQPNTEKARIFQSQHKQCALLGQMMKQKSNSSLKHTTNK